MSSWHYGLIVDDRGYMAVHEIFDWSGNGELSWTDQPVDFGSDEGADDVIWALEQAVKDIKAGCIYRIDGGKLIRLESSDSAR